MPKLNPQVFLDAAMLKLTQDGVLLGCCDLLYRSGTNLEWPTQSDFFEGLFFQYNRHSSHTYWWDSPFTYDIPSGSFCDPDFEARVIALLLAYHIAKDQNKRKRK